MGQNQTRDPGSGFLLERWNGVAVDVQGEGDCGVAETLAHDLGVDVGREGQGGVGMPQIMQADPREA